ncbi:cellulose binding domain-containing protein [Actinomadura sp. 9N407]|uniref:cellulose binding domain-containing protein n=1 Tax=Actinomadura sp. 9N407 TaxID=3375154 RepID=UPI0037A6E9E7
MGRHTRLGQPEDEVPPDEAEPPSGRPRPKMLSMVPVPLLPIVALVLAVGVVSYAMSTQQISLNFAGGAPQQPQTSAKENQVSQRGPGDRASRDARRADGLVVGFRMVKRSSTGFRFTATVANRGQRAVPEWALAFKIPNASIVSVSGATVVRTGEVGWVRSPAGAPALTPGQSVKIVFAATGAAGGPTTCKMNSLPCARV